MSRSKQILFREMILDLHYRLQLAEELFCNTAESLVAAVALEEWNSRSEVINRIREYSQCLQIINADFCRVMEGKQVVFPVEISEWSFELPDGEIKIQLQLQRLNAIARGLETALKSKLLQMEFHDE